MKMLTLFLLFYSLLGVGCSSHSSKTQVALPKITIDLDHLPSLTYKDLFCATELIPLETTDNHLLGIVYPLLTEEYIFMRDNTQQQASCFNKEGKLLFNIANQGSTPHQYKEFL